MRKLIYVLILLSAVIFCAGCASSDKEETTITNGTDNATVAATENVTSAGTGTAATENVTCSFGVILGGDAKSKDRYELESYLGSLHKDDKAPGWVFVEAEQADDLDDIKMRVDVAHEEGFKTLLVPTADWEDFDRPAFASFVGRLSQECQSEAYLIGYCANLYFKPCDFTGVVNDCSEKIRANDRDAIVVIGGLSCGVSADKAPERFVKDLYDCVEFGGFDAISVNPDTYPDLPSEAGWNNWDSLGAVHKIMEDNGDGEKEVWGTGFDIPTRGTGRARDVDARFIYRDKDFMSEEAQAEIWQDAIGEWKKTEGAGVFFFPCSGSDYSFGMFRTDGSAKPSFQVLMDACGA